MTYNLSPFSLLFFYPKLCLICCLQFLFVKRSNNFLTIEIFFYISQQQSIFNFFNHKSFFRLVWSVIFCKNVFIFECITRSPTLNLGSLSLSSISKSINVLNFTSTGFALIFIVFINYIIWYIIYTFLDIKVVYLQILFFTVLIYL